MPRIHDILLNCSTYIFDTKEEAEAGAMSGGTAFIAGVSFSNDQDTLHGYIVTAAHVVRERVDSGQSCVVRLNLAGGGFDTFPLSPQQWRFHPTNDLAVCAFDDPARVYQIDVFNTDLFVTKETIETHNIGIGDDVCIVGRYVDRQGKLTNVPTARFGSIAQMPDEKYPIVHPSTKHKEVSYLVEMRSPGGYSGSPVYLYTHVTPVHNLPFFNATNHFIGPKLLGIAWATFQTVGELVDKNNERCSETQFPSVDSPMIGVCPAWILKEFLDMPEFKKQRQADEIKEAKKRPQERPPKLTSAKKRGADEPDANQIAKRIVDRASNA
jgi:hypothetical protein